MLITRCQKYHVVVHNHIFDTMCKQIDYGFDTLEQAVKKYLSLIISFDELKCVCYTDEEARERCGDEQEDDCPILQVSTTIGLYQAVKQVSYELYDVKGDFNYQGNDIINAYEYYPPYGEHVADKLHEVGLGSSIYSDHVQLDCQQNHKKWREYYIDSFLRTELPIPSDLVTVINSIDCNYNRIQSMEKNELLNQVQRIPICALPSKNKFGVVVTFISPLGIATRQYSNFFQWPCYRIDRIVQNEWEQLLHDAKEGAVSFSTSRLSNMELFLRSYKQTISSCHLRDCLIQGLQKCHDLNTNCLYIMKNTDDSNFHHHPPAFKLFISEDDIIKSFFEYYCPELTPWDEIDDNTLRRWLIHSDKLYSFPYVRYSYDYQKELCYNTLPGGRIVLDEFRANY